MEECFQQKHWCHVDPTQSNKVLMRQIKPGCALLTCNHGTWECSATKDLSTLEPLPKTHTYILSHFLPHSLPLPFWLLSLSSRLYDYTVPVGNPATFHLSGSYILVPCRMPFVGVNVFEDKIWITHCRFIFLLSCECVSQRHTYTKQHTHTVNSESFPTELFLSRFFFFPTM